MSKLRIEFNCLCMFVRDEASRVVHVVMPATARHRAHGVPRHVVRLFTPELPRGSKGIPMEGWMLSFGPAAGEADTASLCSVAPGEVIGLTELTAGRGGKDGLKADPALVRSVGPEVAAVVTLRAGGAVHSETSATWAFKGRHVDLAHRVCWEIGDHPGAASGKHGTRRGASLAALSGMGRSGSATRVLRIYHTTENALPPNDLGSIDPHKVKLHFMAYYHLLGAGYPPGEGFPSRSPHAPRP